MPLTSASTLQQIKDAYADNASYDETADVTKAKAFRTACRLLLLRVPKRSQQGPDSIDLNPELIRKELEAVTEWLAGNDSTAGGSVDGVTYGPGGPPVVNLTGGGA